MKLKDKWNRPKALKIRDVIERASGCNCGSATYWERVLEILSEAESHTDKGFYRDSWFEFGAHVLDKFSLLDHGTGIGFAWLTDDGKLLLEFIRDFGTNDHCLSTCEGWPEWTIEHSWSAEENANDSYGEWSNEQANGEIAK